ncbi:hypothetical protein ACOMHN_043236 [Nucella lapillus]
MQIRHYADMVANEWNINMKTGLLLILCLVSVSGRIHKLKLEDDSRKDITLSTFGFLSGGTLAINITNFKHSENMGNTTMFGFTLDKSLSSGLNSYMEAMHETCILDNPNFNNQKEKMESVFFSFDFTQMKVQIHRVGADMQRLVVSNEPRKRFLTKHDLNRRDSPSQDLDSKLSDHYLMGARRKLMAVVRPPPPPPAPASHDDKPDDKADKTPPGPPPPKPAKAASGTTSSPLPPSSSPSVAAHLPSTSSAAAGAKDQGLKKSPAGDGSAPANESSNRNEAQEAELRSVELSRAEDGTFKSYFLVYIQRPEEEGLYNLFFHNCLSYRKSTPITMTIEITEDNNGNFLTAGEMPVPALYFTFSVLFFIAGTAWLSVLKRSREDVYKIHYLMMVVVFVKSLACLFHGVNMYFIQINGIHEDAWAVMWYIVYLTRGALMFVTVLLIGAGWAFIKHVLTDREKKLFLIIIPLQVLDRVAEVIVEESEEGNQSYMTWKEIFILVDLLCCGAILFPVVWSIRHLQDASRTDGKAAINLQKLKLFRHFYILVVCYIYFTRIIVYLMKITLPFKLVWLTDLFRELAMMVFFMVTGSKFRPATDNPYLQVPLDSDDEEIEMDEVLTKTGNMENVVRVNQKTEGATNQIKQRERESSHEYD